MYDNQHTSDEWLRGKIESLNEVPPSVLWDQQAPWESLEAQLETSRSRKPIWLWSAIGAAACFCLLAGWLFTRTGEGLASSDVQVATIEKTLPIDHSQQLSDTECLESATPLPLARQFVKQDSRPLPRITQSISASPNPQPSPSSDTLSPTINSTPADPSPIYTAILPDSSQQNPPDEIATSEAVVKSRPRAPVMQFRESPYSSTLVNINPSNRKKIKIRLGNSRRQERRVAQAPAVAGMTTRLNP